MSPVDWAQILSAVGACTAAAIAAFTARLSFRQVRYQFEPRLIVANDSFQIKISKDSLKDIWWEKPSEEARYTNGGKTDYMLRLMNIGLGAAHSIKIEMKYDYEAVYRDIISKVASCAPALSIEQDNWGTKILVAGKQVGGFRNPDEGFGLIDYLRPGAQERSIEPFICDPSLSYFCILYAYFLMHEKVVKGVTLPPQVIPIDFIISYDDTGAERKIRRQTARLTITGGRYRDDMSDGLSLIDLRTRDF